MPKKTESGNFSFLPTNLPQVVEINHKVFGDTRGYFMESYSRTDFIKAGIRTRFVQDNHSGNTQKYTLRGLHLQYPNYQPKLLRCVQGEIIDYAVCVFPDTSPWFGDSASLTLSPENRRQFYIGTSSYGGQPILYAHGYLVTTDQPTQVLYKAGNLYDRKSELGLNPFDPDVRLNLPADIPSPLQMLSRGLLNQRDHDWPYLEKLAKQIWTHLPSTRKFSIAT